MSIRSRFALTPSRGVSFSKASCTQSQFAPECDVNNLVRRYLAGDMSVITRRPSINVDCSSAPESFHDAMNAAQNARTAWSSLPDNVRHTFHSFEEFLSVYDSLAAESAQPKDDSSFVTPSDDGAKPDTTAESTPTTT